MKATTLKHVDLIARLITEDPDVVEDGDKPDNVLDQTEEQLTNHDGLISKETIYDILHIIQSMLAQLGGDETPGAILPDVDPNRVLYAKSKPIEYEGPNVTITIDNIEVSDKKAIDDIKERLSEDDKTAGWRFDDFKNRYTLMAIFPELAEEVKEKLGLQIRGFGYEKADIVKLYVSTIPEEPESDEDELGDEGESLEGETEAPLDPQAQADLDILSNMEAPDTNLAPPPEPVPGAEGGVGAAGGAGSLEQPPPAPEEVEEPLLPPAPPKRQRR